MNDADLCKFQAFGFSNSFSSQNNPNNFFSPIGSGSTISHEISNFDRANPIYDMFVKCEYDTGFINEDQPARFLLEYDPTPPVIEKTYALPDPVIQGDKVRSYAETDDKTICKYSETISDYDLMNGKFDGWDEFDPLKTPNLSPDFNEVNVKEILLPALAERTSFTYNVVCKSRTGALSASRKLSFVVDYTQTGTIVETRPSGAITETSVTLTAITNKDANCQYEENGQFRSFAKTGSLEHTTAKTNLAPGPHTYTAKCNFFDPAVTRTRDISFIVDLTPPRMISIDDGTATCSNILSPIFIAEDDESSIAFYNYSIYTSPNILVQDWRLVEGNNPKLNLDNVSTGSTYFLRVIPIDEAGHAGNEKQSDGFLVKDANSTECLSDKTPPTVTLEQDPSYKGIELTLFCIDESGCGDKFIGVAAGEGECSPDQPYTSSIFITEASTVCWNVSDTVGNIAVGQELVTFDDEDDDGIVDDVDQCPDTSAGEEVD